MSRNMLHIELMHAAGAASAFFVKKIDKQTLL